MAAGAFDDGRAGAGGHLTLSGRGGIMWSSVATRYQLGRTRQARDGFKLAAQSLSILEAPRLADRAELGYWAVQVEALHQVEAIPPEHPPLLIADIQGFIDRMGAEGEAEVVAETRRVVARIGTWMQSRSMTPPAVSAATPGTPLAQLDQAAATILQLDR